MCNRFSLLRYLRIHLALGVPEPFFGSWQWRFGRRVGRHGETRCHPTLLDLERRTVPSTLFTDSFQTDPGPNGQGWYDVNHGYDSGRESGLLAPATYVEADTTA